MDLKFLGFEKIFTGDKKKTFRVRFNYRSVVKVVFKRPILVLTQRGWSKEANHIVLEPIRRAVQAFK
jgi:hypothetical protein